jgi:hypothetical protein
MSASNAFSTFHGIESDISKNRARFKLQHIAFERVMSSKIALRICFTLWLPLY